MNKASVDYLGIGFRELHFGVRTSMNLAGSCGGSTDSMSAVLIVG